VTVRKGQAWGTTGPLPAGAVRVGSDAEAGAVVDAARRTGQVPPPLALLGGDLCRTLGGRGDPARFDHDDVSLLPVDLGHVLVDGEPYWFVAHLVARRSWWWGRVLAAMNAQYLGFWDVAPRSHPGDGLLDLLDARLPVGDRLKARSRLPAGTHVPHPAIAERRVAEADIDLDRPTPIWLDGVRLAPARHLAIRVEPDALLCIV
jgi:hypothetical protein